MLVLPAFLESYRALKDRTLKLVYETSELTPEQMATLHTSVNKSGFLAFNTEPFASKDLQFLSDMEVDYDDPKKTPSSFTCSLATPRNTSRSHFPVSVVTRFSAATGSSITPAPWCSRSAWPGGALTAPSSGPYATSWRPLQGTSAP